MKNRQHECLVEAAREIPGVELSRPRGASFELVTIPETKAVLFPWRYASDNSAAVREYGRPLVDAPGRLSGVDTLGVDETAFLARTPSGVLSRHRRAA
jgi:hypothetical protein